MNLRNVILGTAFVATLAGIMVNQSFGERPWLPAYWANLEDKDKFGLSYLSELKDTLSKNRVRDLIFSYCGICGDQMKDFFDFLEKDENGPQNLFFDCCKFDVPGA